jgi:sialate O-acetylesterase
VELAALRASNWPYIRAGQAAALQLPGVGMATAIDLSDQNSPYGAVHPRRKQEVGRRLALSMRALYYQDPAAEQKYSGPVFVSAALGIDSAHSTATLTFQLGTTNNLHLAGTADCKNCCQEPPFEVLTTDRSWKRVSLAQVRNQDQVFLITNEPSIFGIRYAWEGRPECALYNGYGGPDDHAGLPSAPFQWCAYPIGRGAWTHESCRVPMAMNVSIAKDESKLVLQDRIIKRTTERALIQAPVELRLPTFVDSHMVLQRTPHKSRIWGWASPGLAVAATLVELGVQVETIADALTGFWVIDFPPQPASEGHSIKITDGQNLIMLEDIAFGDVFLCSGQSNMQMPVSGAFNAKEEIADSINYPNLRLATVGSVTSDEEMEDAPSRSYYSWARSSPEALTNNTTSITDWTPVFSATCYFFGRDLYQSMNGTVPIGLVVSSWGGQTVETFSSLDALIDNTCGGTVPGVVSVQDNAAGIRAVELTDVSSTSDDDKPQATQLWNAMIHPLRHMRFAGALWYQGEANSQDATSYACRFPAMITDWRLKFDLPDLTFLYVELAGYTPGSTWPWVRAAQAAALSLPQVGGATAIDLGDTHDAPHGEIHPRRKQEVGRRLALKMRAIHYQDESAIWNSMGPVWKGIQFDSNDEDRVTISLSFEGFTAHGLYFAGSADCTHCCDEPPFHILTKSGGWVRAESVSVMVSESRVVIVTGTNNSISGLRYAWEPRPECILYNNVNLPASPLEWCVYPTGQPPWTNQSCGGGMDDLLFHGTDSEDRTISFK